MESKKNYYNILNIDKTNDDNIIRKAYRKLAFDYHPDRNQGDKQKEELFKDVQEAYSILSNKDSKYAYDNNIDPTCDFAHDIFSNLFNTQHSTGFSFHASSDLNEFNDINDVINNIFFSQMFQSEHDTHPMKNTTSIKKTTNIIKLNINDIAFGSIKHVDLLENDIIIKEDIQILPNTLKDTEFIIRNKQYIHTLIVDYDIHDNIKINNFDIYYIQHISLLQLLCGFKTQISIIDTNISITCNKCFDYTQKLLIDNKGITKNKRSGERGNMFIKFKLKYDPKEIKLVAKFHRLFKRIFNKSNIKPSSTNSPNDSTHYINL